MVRWRTEFAPATAHTAASHKLENPMKSIQRLSTCFAAALLLSALGCAATDKRESTGEYIDDSAITSKVKAAILNEPSLKVFQINVETSKNVVHLTGSVATGAEMTKASEVARGVPGVRSVKNDLLFK
jgi:osmotically-inducible protein OsmY